MTSTRHDEWLKTRSQSSWGRQNPTCTAIVITSDGIWSLAAPSNAELVGLYRRLLVLSFQVVLQGTSHPLTIFFVILPSVLSRFRAGFRVSPIQHFLNSAEEFVVLIAQCIFGNLVKKEPIVFVLEF